MFFLYLLVVLVGFLPLAVILYRMRQLKRMRTTGCKTTATVRAVYGSSYRGLNSADITYWVAEKGQWITKRIQVAGLPYQPGTRLPIYYQKDRPSKMVVDPGKNWTLPLVFTGLIALLYIYFCYKIYQAIQAGEM